MTSLTFQKTVKTISRTVTLLPTSVDELVGKKFIIIQPGTGTQNRSAGPKTTKIIDLLIVKFTFDIRGHIITNENEDQLDGSLTDSATTVTVDSTTDFDSASSDLLGYIQIDDEIISYTGTSGTTFTGCVRGVAGTTAASHSDNAGVHIPAYHKKKSMREMINAGGTITMTYAGDTFEVNFDKVSFREFPEDLDSPDKYELTISAVEGVDR